MKRGRLVKKKKEQEKSWPGNKPLFLLLMDNWGPEPQLIHIQRGRVNTLFIQNQMKFLFHVDKI